MFNYTKIGFSHMMNRTNCQDMSSSYKTKEDKSVAIICDGCGSTPFAEIGSIIFTRLFRLRYTSIDENVEKIAYKCYEDMIKFLSDNNDQHIDSTISNFCLFTIIIAVEKEDQFEVYSIGDGYIMSIKQNKDIEYSVLEDDPVYPKFLGYHYISNKDNLLVYNNPGDIFFRKNIFSKNEYSNIIIFSDGVRYILDEATNKIDSNLLRKEFENIILENSDNIKKDVIKFISNNEKIFMDDFSISSL